MQEDVSFVVQKIVDWNGNVFAYEVLSRHKKKKNIQEWITSLSLSERIELLNYALDFFSRYDYTFTFNIDFQILENEYCQEMILSKANGNFIFELTEDKRTDKRLKPILKSNPFLKIFWDDFQNVYSDTIHVIESLNYLKGVKVEIQKLENPQMINLLKVLLMCNPNLKIVIERIETQQDIEFLKSILSKKNLAKYKNNFFLQGFYYHIPEPFSNLQEFLQNKEIKTIQKLSLNQSVKNKKTLSSL